MPKVRTRKPKFSWVKAGAFIPGDRFLLTLGRGKARTTECVRVTYTDPYRVVGLLTLHAEAKDGRTLIVTTGYAQKYRVPKGGKVHNSYKGGE